MGMQTDKEKVMLASVLNTIEDGIYVISRDFTVKFMNEKMIELFGDGIGRKCFEIVNKSNALCPWCRSDRVFAGESVHREVYVPKVDRTFEITSSPFKDVDGEIFKLGIYHDITRRKQREARLKSSVEDYRRIFEHVAVGVYISTKKKVCGCQSGIAGYVGLFQQRGISSDRYCPGSVSVPGGPTHVSGND